MGTKTPNNYSGGSVNQHQTHRTEEHGPFSVRSFLTLSQPSLPPASLCGEDFCPQKVFSLSYYTTLWVTKNEDFPGMFFLFAFFRPSLQWPPYSCESWLTGTMWESCSPSSLTPKRLKSWKQLRETRELRGKKALLHLSSSLPLLAFKSKLRQKVPYRHCLI